MICYISALPVVKVKKARSFRGVPIDS